MGWLNKKRDEGDVAVAPPERESKIPAVSSAPFAEGGMPVSTQEILGLQRMVGNQGVLRMLRSESTSNVNPLNAEAGNSTGGFSQKELSGVHLHTGPESATTARALGVQAFTFGKDIFFGEGKYQPHSESGMRLLSHELAHVKQQSSSGGATASESTLESEANRAESGSVGRAPGQFSSAGGARVQGKEDHGKKGFWRTIGGAFASAGEAIWGGIKAVGKGIAIGAGAVWSAIKWLGTQFWDKLTGVLMRVTDWVRRLPTRIGRLISHLIGGIATLKPWTAAWWKSLVHISTWEDFVFWVGTVAVDVLEIAGIGEAAETLNEFVKFNTRALNSHELTVAYSVFGGSIDLSMVRLDERAVIGPAFTKRAFTSFHTINAWGKLKDHTLVHELTHVWQYEKSGAIYMAQAVHAQISRGQGAYDYGGPAGLQAARTKGQGLTGFNREEQAQIVEDFYRIKNGIPPHVPGGTTADLPLYAHFVKTVSTLTESQLLA